jgi:uroporphyrinogen-III decarboxylase
MKHTLPCLVEIGVDAISGLQPPDVGDVVLHEAKRQYGARVALVGGLDPVYTFDMGTPDAVRRAVRQAIDDAAEGGGYILGTAEAIAPETPAESLRAASEAARQFGVYR